MYLQPLRTIPGIQVHYANQQICMASRGLGLFGSDDRGVNWRRYARLPASDFSNSAMLFGPYQRLIRGGVNLLLNINHAPVDSIAKAEWVAMEGASLLRVTQNGQKVQPFWDLRKGRRTLSRGAAFWQQKLFLAEYWGNPKRASVNLYRIDLETAKAEVFTRFEAGTIRHVHNVEVDPVTQRLWVSTGDENHECVIIELDPDSGVQKTIGQGAQKWRVVSFIFREEAVFWGTDDPFGENQIWRYDRQSQETQAIGAVKGPVYYSKGVGDYLIFGTAVEFGHGQQDRYGRLYAVKVAEEGKALTVDTLTVPGKVHEIYRQPKDSWHPRFFGYGLFELNAGNIGGNRFWATSKGFKGGLRSTLFEVSEKASTQPVAGSGLHAQ